MCLSAWCCDRSDEVREEDTKRVLTQIRDVADQFHTNQFVITCRIAAKDYTFERFTEVEVADFNQKQIAIFAQNWFRLSDSVKAERFIQKLNAQLPSPNCAEWEFRQWWKANGTDWTKRLETLMNKYRNIGHDWQFSEEQKELLGEYYDANKLLVDCLNSDCYVSREVRQEIEDTLLLPMSEIGKRQQGRVS